MDRGSVLLGEPMRDGLRARLHRERPRASLADAIAAVGGALGTLGMLALIADDGGRVETFAAGVVVLAASYALALLGPATARPAALAGGLVAPLVIAGTLVEDLDGRWTSVVPALVAGALWLAILLAPGMRGAPVLVAAVLLAGWIVLVGLAFGDQASGVSSSQAAGSLFFDGPSTPLPGPFGTFDASVPDGGALTLVVALCTCIAGIVADARGWRVLATPFLAVTSFLGLVGLSMVQTGTGDVGGTAFLVVVVGAVLAAGGGVGERRGSTWIGVALGGAGLLPLVEELADGGRGAGALLLLLAVALLAAAVPLERVLRERFGGREPGPAEPAAF